MTCAACGHENPERAKFCLECGTPAGSRCASCGTELPPAAKFCLECGTRTAPGAPSRADTRSLEARGAETRGVESRKVVSIIFADLAGSTALHERLDAESTRHLMD
ncbi:MAG: zinc-ribbon domain-containing protein, partial [Gaiellaceae bacterium]